VPVTILSRCQRFDLRRIESAELAAHLKSLAGKEGVKIDEGALSLIARAAEGSVRDALSLLDQALAMSESDIAVEAVRVMLGLADRGLSLDLFELTMSGKIADALALTRKLYDAGADPLAVMQDLLEIVHFLTRLKVAPAAEGFFDGGSAEAARAAAMAKALSTATLTRTWSLMMKGLIEVRDSVRPMDSFEMVLIRLAYAADLPPTDQLVRDVMENGAPPASSPRSLPPSGSGPSSGGGSPRAAAVPASRPVASEGPMLRTLEDVSALAQAKNTPLLKAYIDTGVHLVKLEPGRLEFRPSERAPRTLAADLAKKLTEWTGTRWIVSISREPGAPTLTEKKAAEKAARHEKVLQEPMVRAVFDRFPGATIVAVRDKAAEATVEGPVPEDKDED